MSATLIAVFSFVASPIAQGFLQKFGEDIYSYTKKELPNAIQYTFEVAENAESKMAEWLDDRGGVFINETVDNAALGSLIGGLGGAYATAVLLTPFGVPILAGALFGAAWVGGATLLGFGGKDNQVPYWYFR